jgi:transcriptional regulator with XRE-family HTH domain
MQNKLVEFLKEKGLSGRALAGQLGLSVSYVSLVLKGTRPVSFFFAATVAERMGLDP